MRTIKTIITIIGIGIFSSAHADIIYTLNNGLSSQVINPLVNAQSAADYYDYPSGRASGTPAFGTAEETAFFWLYEDSNTGILSLGMIFDTLCEVNCTSGGTMNLTTSGVPNTAVVTVNDDENTTGDMVNGTETWWWNNHNTDGGVISGLENLLWSIDIDINAFTGLDSFYFLDGPDSTTPSSIGLNETMTINITATRVPEPASLLILAMGLIGVAFSTKRRLPN